MSLPRPASRTDRPALHLVKPDSPALGADRDALDFDSVFRRYSPYVATIGLRLLGSNSELDDLVQEVFLQAHRGLDRIRDPGAVRGWLARICVRRASKRLRRRRLRAFLSLDVPSEMPELVHGGTTPEQAAEVGRVYRLLATFPTDERVVWVLRHVEGESLDDIASLCECSKSTVQRRLRAAQARFEREALP